MNMNQSYWGPPKTRTGTLKKLVIYIILGLSAFGWHSDFVPSDKWLLIGTVTSVILTVLITVEWWIEYRSGRATLRINENATKFKRYIYVYIGIPAVWLSFIWVALTHGLASGVTILFGSPYEITQTLEKEHVTVKFGCDYQLRGNYLKTAVPDYLCISKEYYESGTKTVKIKLSGKNTFLGFLIERAHENRL